jgi:PPOX class probable F420-dependent enzyme
MAQPISDDALRAFLSAGTRTAKVAVTRKDGSPSVSPVWFLLDGDDLVFTTMNTSLKYKAISRDPRVSVSVDDENFPYGFVSIRGTAKIEDLGSEELLPLATQIAARYVPAEQAEKFGARNAVPEEVLIRITPAQVFAWSGIAD